MVTLKKKKITTMYFGKIPRDWKVVKVDEITLFHKQGYYTNEKYTTSGQYILLRATDMQNPYIHIDTAPRINVSKKDFESYKVEKGDILIVRSGSIGRYGIVEEDKKAIFGSYLIKFKLNQKNVSNKYFGYLYNSDFTFRQLKRIQQGSSNININAENIKAIYLPLPSLEEQEQIATVLSDMDDLIESLEKIIEKKKKIKQGTMQQLLTGKKRLPGFSGEWKIVKVDDFGSIVTGGTPATRSEEYWNGDIPWVTPTDITNRKNILKTGRMITQKGIETINKLPAKTVLVTCIASIGKNAILMQEGACNQQINAIIPNDNYNSDFLYYLMENNKNYLKSKAGITATNIISKQTFSEIEFLVPNIKEQQAIAEILSDMDAELEALEEKLKKYKKLKEGMMQELLTGRIRLV